MKRVFQVFFIGVLIVAAFTGCDDESRKYNDIENEIVVVVHPSGTASGGYRFTICDNQKVEVEYGDIYGGNDIRADDYIIDNKWLEGESFREIELTEAESIILFDLAEALINNEESFENLYVDDDIYIMVSYKNVVVKQMFEYLSPTGRLLISELARICPMRLGGGNYVLKGGFYFEKILD